MTLNVVERKLFWSVRNVFMCFVTVRRACDGDHVIYRILWWYYCPCKVLHIPTHSVQEFVFACPNVAALFSCIWTQIFQKMFEKPQNLQAADGVTWSKMGSCVRVVYVLRKCMKEFNLCHCVLTTLNCPLIVTDWIEICKILIYDGEVILQSNHFCIRWSVSYERRSVYS